LIHLYHLNFIKPARAYRCDKLQESKNGPLILIEHLTGQILQRAISYFYGARLYALKFNGNIGVNEVPICASDTDNNIYANLPIIISVCRTMTYAVTTTTTYLMLWLFDLEPLLQLLPAQ
jgi:hypothetical protein